MTSQDGSHVLIEEGFSASMQPPVMRKMNKTLNNNFLAGDFGEVKTAGIFSRKKYFYDSSVHISRIKCCQVDDSSRNSGLS